MLQDNTDGSSHQRNILVILKQITLRCKAEWERDKTNTHKILQSFGDYSEAWLRMFRDVEHA